MAKPNFGFNLAKFIIFEYIQAGATATTENFLTDWTDSASDTEEQGFDKRLENAEAAGSGIGLTQGGASLDTSVTRLDINADSTQYLVDSYIQNKAGTISVTSLELSAENLKKYFNAAITDNGDGTFTADIPALDNGYEVSVYMQSETDDAGIYSYFKIPRAKIFGSGTITFNKDDVAKLTFEIVLLQPYENDTNALLNPVFKTGNKLAT